MKFSFGENWLKYSARLDADRVADAERSLRSQLRLERLGGLTFFDVGCGSGLFSLAAARLQAEHVLAIDVDEASIRATERNVAAFLSPPQRRRVQIRHGDILRPDPAWQSAFDIVYAWGSLHHTGAMWRAIDSAARCCRPGGRLALAIYNETRASRAWHRAKRWYNEAPPGLQLAMVAGLSAARGTARTLTGKRPFRCGRGMSLWYDAIDWLGGLPYEYATPDSVVGFLHQRGFELMHSCLTDRSGCNEFLFARSADQNVEPSNHPAA